MYGGAGTIGKHCILDFDTTINQSVCAIQPNGFCNMDYIHTFIEFQRPYWMEFAAGSRKDPNINQIIIKHCLLPIPPIKEQYRIILKINQLYPYISQFENCNNELSQLNKDLWHILKKSILRDAIQGKLVPQIESEGTAQELLEQIQQEKLKLVKEGTLKKSTLSSSVIFKGDDNKYYEKVGKDISCIDDELPFGIPNTWSWSRLGNIAQLKLGKTPPRGDSRYWNNGTIPWVSISDMSKEQLITNTKEYISEEAAKDLFQSRISPKGSLLMSFKLSIGKVALLDIDAYHNEAIVTITPYFDNGYAFRDYLMLTLPLLSQLGESKDAIKGKTLNSKSLSNLPIPLSPLTEQLRILAKVMELSKLLKQ
jgi:type I restriction enzyme S subunit